MIQGRFQLGINPIDDIGIAYFVAIPFDPGQVSTLPENVPYVNKKLQVAIPFDPGQVSTIKKGEAKMKPTEFKKSQSLLIQGRFQRFVQAVKKNS